MTIGTPIKGVTVSFAAWAYQSLEQQRNFSYAYFFAHTKLHKSPVYEKSTQLHYRNAVIACIIIICKCHGTKEAPEDHGFLDE